jgi:TDG/mug DNA glycosylase family protein
VTRRPSTTTSDQRPTPAPRPSKADLIAAKKKTVLDVIAPGLTVLFCGINPGLYTAAIGHHFGRPGNRFWPALFAGGFTPRLFDPSEKEKLLELGYGITNLVSRATLRADELTAKELVAGAKVVTDKVLKYKPRYLAVVGISSYRVAFDRPKAVVGPQPDTIGKTKLWVLPNPSGLNAHYRPKELAEVFGQLREAVGA